jgi:thioesterase-3
MKKVLSTKTKVRFQDCDPFNHLNNAKYIDYMINAREDQILEEYQLDIFTMARKEGKVWVVATNQIAYLSPAFTMESIVIESQLLQYSPKSVMVETRMWDERQTKLKSFMWVNFVHYDLVNKTVLSHSEDILKLFEQVLNPLEETTFEDRVKN